MEVVPQILADSHKKFSSLVKRPEKFLQHDEDLLQNTKLLTKVVYDVSKLLETEPCSKTLPELITDGFDSEQVWAGVELQNQARLPRFEAMFGALDLDILAKFPLLLGDKSREKESVQQTEVAQEEEEDEEAEEEFGDDQSENGMDEEEPEEPKSDEDVLNDPDFQNMSDSDGDDLPLFGDLSDDEKDEGDEGGTFKEREKRGGKVSEVDDQFFKLSDMEKFLEAEDRKEMKKGPDDKDEEDAIDMFAEEDDDGEQRAMYKEYFDKDAEADNGGEGDDEDDEEDEGDLEDDEEEEEGDEDLSEAPNVSSKRLLLSDDEDADTEEIAKSSHEVATDRLTRKISRLEETAVGSKPWQMGGEVAAGLRQENSLLAEDLDYDTAVRHAPVSRKTKIWSCPN